MESNIPVEDTAIQRRDLLAEARRQLDLYYPRHTRRELWDFLGKLDWQKYRYAFEFPSSRWIEDIQLGVYKHRKFFLRGTECLLRYRPESGSRAIGEETGVGKAGTHEIETLVSDNHNDHNNKTDEDWSSSESSLSDIDETDPPVYGQIMIQVQTSQAQPSQTQTSPFASPIFAQLGLVSARLQSGDQKHYSDLPTSYYLAVNIDEEYKPGAIWLLSTAHRKFAKNTFKPPSAAQDLQIPRFAAAQIASSLDQMKEMHESELKFVNIQEEYTLVDWF